MDISKTKKRRMVKKRNMLRKRQMEIEWQIEIVTRIEMERLMEVERRKEIERKMERKRRKDRKRRKKVTIRLEGLPFSANCTDIRKFFAGLHISKGGVSILGGTAGKAFVTFSSDEVARRAMLLSGGPIHGSSVRLLLSSRREMRRAIEDITLKAPLSKEEEGRVRSRSRSPRPRKITESRSVALPVSREQMERNDEDEPTNCCLVQNLPQDATNGDLLHFFSEVRPVLMFNKSGEPSGDAFCVFQTPDECQRAMKKRSGLVGNQMVRNDAVRREKMLQVLGHLPPFPPSTGHHHQPVNPQRRPQQAVHP